MEKKELIVFISFYKVDSIFKNQIETKLLSLYDYYQTKEINFKIIHMDNLETIIYGGTPNEQR